MSIFDKRYKPFAGLFMQYIHSFDNDKPRTETMLGAGIITGFTFIDNDRGFTELNIGVGYGFNYTTTDPEVLVPFMGPGFYPRGGFCIGNYF